MGDTHGKAKEYRRIVLVAELEGELGEGPAFLAICGLQHGTVGGAGIETAILLVLAGMHAGVVGYGDHQGAGDAGISSGK